jgi:hypothetical protein
VKSRVWARSWLGGVGTALLAACLATSLVGCSKKKEETKAKAEDVDAKKKKPQGDRYADGKRLEGTLKDWSKRWADTVDLPACDPLLKDAADLELCKTAATALATMKTAAAKPEPEATLIHDAAELAFATESASEKLRTASMEKMQAEHKTNPAASGGPAITKPTPSSIGMAAKTRPVGSAFSKSLAGSPGAGKLTDKLRAEPAPLDPAMQVMQAYSRVNRAALRYLSQYLQFGPLPTRKATFTELEALSKRKEAWPALGRTLREAAMAENDPDLQGKLKGLAPKLSRRAPGAPGAPDMGGMPPGHPPLPGGGAPTPAAPPTPPAPAAPEKK